MATGPIGKHLYSHLYKTKRWQAMRMRHLMREPLCVYCKARGKVSAGLIADHIVRHQGNEALFYKESNLQTLCKRCHDSDKQRIENDERKGKVRGNDVDGMPTDPSHPWYTSSP